MPFEQQNETLISSLRQEREGLLKHLDERNGDIQETFKKLDLVEDLLAKYDSTFTPPPRRLSFLQPVDAAIVVLMESGYDKMPVDELIRRMLAHGVCRGSQGRGGPKATIMRGFGHSTVKKRLHFDKATGYVSIAKGYYEKQMRKKK